jgi:hypothetical protein
VNRKKGTADEYKLRPSSSPATSSSSAKSSSTPMRSASRGSSSGKDQTSTPTGTAKKARQMSLLESFKKTSTQSKELISIAKFKVVVNKVAVPYRQKNECVGGSYLL